MQEEVENRTVNLAISTTKLTARSLLNAFRAYMNHRRNVKAKKAYNMDTHIVGEQTIGQLLGQNQGATNIEIEKTEISGFKRILNKYVVLGLVATNLGEAWRIAKENIPASPILGLMAALPAAFTNFMPSFHPFDLCVGIVCGCGLRLAVYLRGKNAKKYRHNEEYGSARWGNAQDIAPFVAPKFEDNIILTQTERLMMSNRPANPKNARNKNVLIVGGSGSGKTRFWIKPSAPVRAV